MIVGAVGAALFALDRARMQGEEVAEAKSRATKTGFKGCKL
jgi:hypothetical protein